MKKTLWEKVYSALGFWKYIDIDSNGNKRKIFYWCCFPYGIFFRKFDLFSMSIK